MLRIATRRSPLALWQARCAAGLIGGPTELVGVETVGDRRPEVAVRELGGEGAFVKEVQAAVLEGRADVAVHSAKDLPSAQASGLRIAAVLERGDPRDALVGSALQALPPGALLATGSPRRLAQLGHLRPDLTFTGLRGNIETRLSRAGRDGVAAVVVAAAALERLGLLGRAAELLDTALVTPQAGQGAIALECREDDEVAKGALAAADHPATHAAVEAERGFLRALGAGCDTPAGAYCRVGEDGRLELEGVLASMDGRVLLRRRAAAVGGEPAALGAALAAEILDGCGGRLLLGPAA